MTSMNIESSDNFQRKPMADKIIRLLTSNINVSPMLIDGDWGTGKTVFCKRLISDFKEKHPNYNVIYIDAFKEDHADNPLMTILAEIMKTIPDEKVKKAFVAGAVPIIKFGLKLFGKAVFAHAFKQNVCDAAQDFEKIFQDTANKEIDALIENSLREHALANSNLEILQSLIKEQAKGKQLIIFIDELDRCRPDFAVQMIEVIKHIFEVEGVKFVLVTNTKQLVAAIHHRYGATVDATKYLDKFLKFSCILPHTIPDSYDNVLVSIKYYKHLIETNNNLKKLNITDSSSYCFTLVKCLITEHEISLREVETFVRHLEIFHTISEKNPSKQSNTHNLLQLLGIFIFSMNSLLAKKILISKAKAEEVMEYLCIKILSKNKNSTLPTLLKLLSLGCGPDTPLKEEIRVDMEVELGNFLNNHFIGYILPESEETFIYSIIVDTIKELSLHS